MSDKNKSIFDNDWLATELERFEINYDNISVNEDTIIQAAVESIEVFLSSTSYDRYIKVRQRKYKYMDATKLNECIQKCYCQQKTVLRYVDVFDTIVTYYELDTKLCWDNLSYDNQIAIAKDISNTTGNDTLLKQLMEQRMSSDFTSDAFSMSEFI